MRKPVFVTACDSQFFGIAEGVIESLDAHWPDHRIAFYDMGLSPQQRQLVRIQIFDEYFPFDALIFLA